MRNPRRGFIFFLAWAGLAGNFILSTRGRQPTGEEKLKSLLQKTAAYCERLKGLALHFVCEESIEEKTTAFKRSFLLRRGSPQAGYKPAEDLRIDKVTKKTYLYDYQMVKKGDDFKERRTLLAENGKRKKEQDAELKTTRMSSRFLVFGPVGFLSRYWQDYFRYQIVAAEIIAGREAVAITAVPKEPREENNSFGKIWVDAADSSILKIEWEPRSIAGLDETVASSVGEIRRKITWTVTYDIVYKEVRFPSRQVIKEVYITKNDKEHLKYEATYAYEKYRYFVVETEVVW
jgi:hypothetical protein